MEYAYTMTVSNGRATQLSRSTVVVTWDSDTTPAPGFNIERDTPTHGLIEMAVLNGQMRSLTDESVGNIPLGDTATYHITDLDSSTGVVLPPLLIVDVTSDQTFGPVDELADTIRYTTLADVKEALGIADTEWDDAATQAIIALEVMMDVYMGRSLPDTGANPAIPGIPERVKNAALVGGMAIFKLRDAPGGVGGADIDGYIGLYEPAAAAREAFNAVRPQLRGLKIQWGVAS